MTLGLGAAFGGTIAHLLAARPTSRLLDGIAPSGPTPPAPAERTLACPPRLRPPGSEWMAPTPPCVGARLLSCGFLDMQLPSDSLKLYPPYQQVLDRAQHARLPTMPEGTRPIEDVRHSVRKDPPPFIGKDDSVVIFCLHTADGAIAAHVRHTAVHLARHFTHVIASIATDGDLDRVQIPYNVQDLFAGVLLRENVGIDFAGWAKAMRVWPRVWDGAQLILINDSNFGPIRPSRLAAVARRLATSTSDYIGLLESLQGLDEACARPGSSSRIRHHFQSFFLAFKHAALTDEALQNFWYREVFALPDKHEAILRYELTMTARAQAAGLRTEALFSQVGADACQNPSHVLAGPLLASGYPFVKRDLFLKPPLWHLRDRLDLPRLQVDYAEELPLALPPPQPAHTEAGRPLTLRYEVCGGLCNQLYAHFSALAMARALGAELVLAPAMSRSSFGDYNITDLPFDQQANAVTWRALPLEALLDVPRLRRYWQVQGLAVRQGTAPDTMHPNLRIVMPRPVQVPVDTFQESIRGHIANRSSALASLPPHAGWLIDMPCTFLSVAQLYDNPPVRGFAASFRFAPQIEALADRVGHRLNRTFNGIHLRLERDASFPMATYGGRQAYWRQYLQTVDAARFDGSAMIYLASGLLGYGDQAQLGSFVRALRSRGIRGEVVTKEMVLPAEDLNSLAVEQQAALDFAVMLSANHVVGVAWSTFSYLLRERRALEGRDPDSMALVGRASPAEESFRLSSGNA